MEVDEISGERKEAEDRIPERSKKRTIERKRNFLRKTGIVRYPRSQ